MPNDAEKAALERRLFKLTEFLVHGRPNDPLPTLLQRRIERCVDALHGRLESQPAAATPDTHREIVADSGSDYVMQQVPVYPAAPADQPELMRIAPLLPRRKRNSKEASRERRWK